MALDFGLIGEKTGVISSDYKSAGSHQSENLKFKKLTTLSTWEEVYVVTTGKTFYVSAIIVSSGAASNAIDLGTGPGGSEVQFFNALADNTGAAIVTALTPIKFSSGTRIAGRQGVDTSGYITLVGWEE